LKLAQFKIDKKAFRRVKLDLLSLRSWLGALFSGDDRAVATSLLGSLFFLDSWVKGRRESLGTRLAQWY